MTDAKDPLVECESQVAMDQGCAKSSKFRGGFAAIVTVAVVTLFIGFRRSASQTEERSATNLPYDTIQKFDLSGMATTKCWKNRTF